MVIPHGHKKIDVTAKRIRGNPSGSPRTDSLLISVYNIGMENTWVSLYRDTGHDTINNRPVFGNEGQLKRESYDWGIETGWGKLFLRAKVPEDCLKGYKIIKVIAFGRRSLRERVKQLGPESYIIYDSQKPFGTPQEVFKKFDFSTYYLKNRQSENQVDLDVSHSGPTP